MSVDSTGRHGEHPAQSMTHQHAIESMASERYLLGEMSDDERNQFEEHYFECAECAEDIRAAERMRAAVRAGARAAQAAGGGVSVAAGRGAVQAAAAFPSSAAVASPAAPGPGIRGSQPEANRRESKGRVLRPASWWSGDALFTYAPWAATAALAVFFTHQSFVTIPALREELLRPQDVSLAMLRGATRGEPRGRESLLPIAPDARFVSIAADVTFDEETRALAYELRNDDGAVVLSGRAGLPRMGAPLSLLIPAETFEVPARYTLTVRDADRPDTVLGEYPFVTMR